MSQDDETTPLPPSEVTIVAQAIRHAGDAIFALTSASRSLELVVAELRVTNAQLAERLLTVIKAEEEERVILNEVAKQLATQGVQLGHAASEVKALREETGEHALVPAEAGEKLHTAVGKAVVKMVSHKLVPWLAAAGIAGWEAVRAFLHR